MSQGARRTALVALAAAGWLGLAVVTARYLWLSVTLGDAQPMFIHYDWHAYAAGARDLLDRTLYRVPLELGNVPVPIDQFNLPPLAAAEAVPFLAGGLDAGGVAWQLVGAVGVAVAALVIGRLVTGGIRDAVLVAGVVLAAYVVAGQVVLRDELAYWWGLTLGTNNFLVLGLVAGTVLAVARGHERAAGVLLGAAVATKLWPVTLAVVLVREARWRTLAWAGAFVAVQGVLFLVWLGPDAIPDLVRAIGAQDPDPTGLIGVAALRDVLAWWPAWAGWVVTVALLAMPARGLTGMGLGILAGLAAITNLWGHYLPTVLLGAGLVAIGLWSAATDQRMAPSTRSSMSSVTTAPATRNGPNGM